MKVIIIGDYYTYSLLNEYDEEFQKLFKVMADFEIDMDRSDDNIERFTRFVSTKCQMDGLNHFTPGAVAALVDYATRLSDEQSKLTAHLKTIGDVISEIQALIRSVHKGKLDVRADAGAFPFLLLSIV